MPQDERVYRFGEFVLEPRERSLRHCDTPIPLTGKAFDLLVALVSRAGHLVTKDELLQKVWPGVVVEEVNLSVNISALRKALAAQGGGQDWIETVPRQGYRFRDRAAWDTEVRTTPAMKAQGNRRWLVAAAVALAGLVVGAVLWTGRGGDYASVAVLPFQVDDGANAYLADGLAERAIERLAGVPSLRVVPRASAFRFQGADPLEAGRQLGTAAVVTGALVGGDGGVSLHVELLDLARGTAVWKRQYEARLPELAGLQERLAADLRQAVASGRVERAGSGRPVAAVDSEAYRQYLQGRYHWNQRSEPALKKAIVHFEQAIARDPHFALAYAALADAHTALGYLGYVTPVGSFPVARPHALKALELDPSLAQAHAALAYIKFYFDWDWAGAEQEFRRALVLGPDDPVAHQWFAVYLRAAGKADAAQREIEAAQRLDPLSLAINTDVGFHHYYAGRYPEAITQLQAVLGMKKDFLLARLWLARSLLAVGRLQEALDETAQAEQGLRDWPVLVTARGFTYGRMGKRDEARAVLREMEQLSSRKFVTAYGMALVYAGLGEKDDAFAWLQKAFDERSHWLVWLRLDPRWNSLRADPRFEALVLRMNYPA